MTTTIDIYLGNVSYAVNACPAEEFWYCSSTMNLIILYFVSCRLFDVIYGAFLSNETTFTLTLLIIFIIIGIIVTVIVIIVIIITIIFSISRVATVFSSNVVI